MSSLTARDFELVWLHGSLALRCEEDGFHERSDAYSDSLACAHCGVPMLESEVVCTMLVIFIDGDTLAFCSSACMDLHRNLLNSRAVIAQD